MHFQIDYPNGSLSPYCQFLFYCRYIENAGGSLSVFSDREDEKEKISGRIHCPNMDQRYNFIDGKVAVDGEPFVRRYH